MLVEVYEVSSSQRRILSQAGPLDLRFADVDEDGDHDIWQAVCGPTARGNHNVKYWPVIEGALEAEEPLRKLCEIELGVEVMLLDKR